MKEYLLGIAIFAAFGWFVTWFVRHAPTAYDSSWSLKYGESVSLLSETATPPATDSATPVTKPE